MDNRHANTFSRRRFVEELSATRMPPLVAPSRLPNLEPREHGGVDRGARSRRRFHHGRPIAI
jgi:hypothetical protein